MVLSPTISVVMPVYNSAATVAPAVESVLNQTYRDFEFIIVNDGSTDGSLAILESFGRSDGRIRIFSISNRGVGLALDHGIKQAKGKYIARMDADDISAPERLERQIDYLENCEEVVLCGCWTWNFCRELGVFAASTLPDEDAFLRKMLFDEVSSTFVHSSVIFRKDAYFLTRGYRFSCAQDYDLWLQLSELGKLGMVPIFGLLYHTHLGSVTANRRSLGSKVKQLALKLHTERKDTGQERTNALDGFSALQSEISPVNQKSKRRFHRYVLALRMAQSGRKFHALGNFISILGIDGLGLRSLWRIFQLMLGRTPFTGDALFNLDSEHLFPGASTDVPWQWAKSYLQRMGVSSEVYSDNETLLKKMKMAKLG
jgi:glycosyltransferase involved in cell wall biosynthesis